MEEEKKIARRSDFLLVLVAVIWGMGFPVTQMAIDANMSAGLIVAIRFALAAVIMGLVFRRELSTLTGQEIRDGAIAGLLVVTGFLLQTVGLEYTTPSNNAFLSATNVIMVPILSWVVLRQRPSGKLFLAAIGTFVGAAMLTLSPQGLKLNIGDLLTLGCALAFSVQVLYLGTVVGRISAAKLSFLQMATAAVVGILYVLLFERGSVGAADFEKGIWPVVYLGLFSTAFCFFAQTYAQRFSSPTKVVVILSTEGLLGSIFSVMLGYEALTVNLFVGGAIIFTSLMMMELDFAKLFEKKGTSSPVEEKLLPPMEEPVND